MVKFDQLKLDQLKKELSKYDLPTSGNKAELQKRLMDEFQRQGLDIDSHEFECKDELELSTRSMASGIDFNSMFAAMMEKFQEANENSRTMMTNMETKLLEKNENMLANMETKLQEANENSRTMMEKFQEANENSRTMMTNMETKLLEKNEKMLAKMESKLQEGSKVNNEKLLTEIEARLEGISESTNKKFQEISATIDNKIDGVKSEFDQKLADVDNKIGDLESKVNGIQQQGGPVRVLQETSGRTKTPTFDGSLPFNVFKFQFETVADRNQWGNDQKAVELILALKGTAAEVLETVPVSSRNNFDDIMAALQRKYGSEHKTEIYRLELRSRIQKLNETLQDFAQDIERLVQLSYPGDDQSLKDRFKIEAFIQGIRDPDIKLAVYTAPKSTFAETVTFALAQETARSIAKHQIYKVRGVDVVSENQNCVEQMKEALRQILDEKQSKPKSKCYNCGKVGHFQRSCKAPRRQTASPESGQRVEPQSPQEQSFQRLKILLCSAPILACPVAGEKFVLDTDASACGIGGVLSQVVDGTERVLGYYSRTLSKPEKNYCVTRRELLAVVECVKHYHKYLYGQKFQLRTDHSALRWLLQFKQPEGQLARWIERLQSYDFTIDHRKGRNHGNADALSRRPCSVECRHCAKAEAKECVIDVRLMHVDSSEDWSAAQRNDPVLAKILLAKEEDKRPTRNEISPESPLMKSYWALWDSLKVIDGCLYRTWESADGKTAKNLIVVPSSKIKDVLKEFHDGPSGGHLGVAKTLEKLKQRFYWIGCPQNVSDWIANCSQCIAAKGPVRRSRGQLQQYNSGAPFERIAMDVAGPFPESEAGNRYVLVVMDYFSKWPEVYAIPNQEAKTVIEVFVDNWICRYGVPLELHSDQGRNFESTMFREMCELYGIRKTRTTPLHPQSDGMVERFNRTLEEYLRKVVSTHQRDWDQHIPKFLLAYRTAAHDSTSKTPAKIVFGTELRLPGDLQFGTKPATANEDHGHFSTQEQENLNELHEFVRNKIRMVSDKMKARYDRAANSDGFDEGQLVLLYNPQRRKGLSPKLQTNWDGPYQVVKRINDVVYRIQKHKSPRSKMKVVHLERLAAYGKRETVPIRDEQA